MRNYFDQHDKIVLQFSGGKDSLATLYLCRKWWDKMTVVWLNTGAAFPETIAQMEGIKKLVPNFVEINSNQPEWIASNGIPSDVVPILNTILGKRFTPNNRIMIQDWIACCGHNLWLPMQEYIAQSGYTLVIRGQRADEEKTNPIRSGHIENGVEYLFPLEDWTSEQVFEYLRSENIEIPAHYSYMNTSLDCMDCTAHLSENVGKFKYMAEFHHELHDRVVSNLIKLNSAIDAEKHVLETLCHKT